MKETDTNTETEETQQSWNYPLCVNVYQQSVAVNGNDKKTFSSGHPPTSLFSWFKPTTPPEGSTVISGIPEATPSALCHPYLPLEAQQVSCLFSQSHWRLLSAVSDTALMAWRRLWPLTPTSLSKLVIDDATKPLHPTSTGRISAVQPCCCASTDRSAYRRCFLSYASSSGSSQGSVSSTIKTFLTGGDQNTKSGLRVVIGIYGEKARRWPTFVNL